MFVAVLLIGALTQFLPRLTRAGEVVNNTPVRSDFAAVQPIVLEPGARACLGDVTFDPAVRSAQLTFAPSVTGSAPTRLTLEASAPDYRASATVEIAHGQGGRLDIPFAPPRRGAIGTLCIRNGGRRTTALAGTADSRALTRSTIVVDGERQGRAFSVTLHEAGGRSLLSAHLAAGGAHSRAQRRRSVAAAASDPAARARRADRRGGRTAARAARARSPGRDAQADLGRPSRPRRQ